MSDRQATLAREVSYEGVGIHTGERCHTRFRPAPAGAGIRFVRTAAAERETQAITSFATELATKFHAYYRDRRVVDAEDPQTSAARLALVDATRITLARSLGLLGISAPESM